MPPHSSDHDLLDEAYQRVRAAPHSAEANLQLAITLVRRRRLDDATRHACIAAKHATSDWPHLELLGIVLFQLGQFFPLAYNVLVQASRNGPLKAEAIRMLAALCHRKGEVDNARRCIAATAQLETIVGPRHPHPDRPKVLRLRSAEKSFYGIKTNQETGLRYCWLKGGHFSDKNLIDPERVNLYIATVFGDNLRTADGLPDFDLFMNSVSCPDLDPIGLDHVEAFVARFPDVPVINLPDKVRRTTRAENARRLSALPDVSMPQTELFVLDRPADAMTAQIEEAGLGYPLIVRHRGTQTGKTLEKVDTRSALVAWLSAQSPGTPVYATAYVDCRWQDGFHHKTRAFFIDGTFFPVANLACDTWQVHSGDRYRVMSSTPSTQEDEKRYLGDPEAYLGPKAFRGLHAIRDAIGLDFFGIDFTLDPEGNVLVFEANAAMRHNFDHAGNFPYTRPYLERISKAFADMVDRRAVERRHRAS